MRVRRATGLSERGETPDRRRPAVSVVVPVYGEADNIRPFLRRLVPVLDKLGSYEVIFSADPCSDGTEEILEAEIERNPQLGMLVMSRRFGQPSAVIAGLHAARGDAVVVIDVDLQDPPELIAEMHARLRTGYDVVYAKRRSRKGETLIKKAVSSLGYRFINAISEVEIPRDTGDFRILSRRVVEEIKRLPEGHGFLRGLVAFVGHPQTFIEYDRDERAHGSGNYNRYLGSLKIALNGMVGFSNFLLTATLISGIAIAGLSLLVALFIVATWAAGVRYPLGLPTLTVLALFLGGVQLVSIGILGEYVGRIYDEVKRRPGFIVERSVNVELPERREIP